MIAQRLIEDARAAGLSIEVDGGDLIVEADGDPPPSLLAELRQHKAEVIALLRPQDARDGRRGSRRRRSRRARRDHRGGYAALASMPAPSGFSPERWQRIIDATGKFIDRWAADAIKCGWSDLDVFGCNPDRPDRRFDCMGLAPLLDRCEVVSIDDEGADLVTVTGARQRYRRRPLPADTVSLWELARAAR